MNNAEYWRRRSLYAKQKQLDAEGEYEVVMRSRLKDLENEIMKEADYFITRYAETNEISKKNAAEILSKIDTSKFDMTLKEFRAKAIAGGFKKELDSAYFKTRIERLKQLNTQLVNLAAEYAEIEEQHMALALAEQYKGTYELQEYNKYLAVGGTDINFAHFNEQELKNIVYQPWQGSDFSKRIWHTYTKTMPDVLTDVIARSVLMGYSYQRVERMLRDRFEGIASKDLHRLAVTEMGHAAEQATLQFYKDSDIDQYKYLATLESHTCEVCAHLDERIFYVKDEKEGINYPLIHPYCRCTTTPYMKDLPDVESRWYRDPVTGRGKWTNRDMNYREWAKEYGVKPLNKKKFIEAKKVPQMNSRGALNLSNPKDFERATKHAKRYYEELRNFDRTYLEDRISKNSGVKKSVVSSALKHVLDSEYLLKDDNGQSFQHFYPDYDMAQSFQRLLISKPLKHDIIMLNHEALEAHYMDSKRLNYDNAHQKANELFNYQQALLKFKKELNES